MLDWMSAINAHIHIRYLAEWHVKTDFWEQGNVHTSFWKVKQNLTCVLWFFLSLLRFLVANKFHRGAFTAN
jgi:hypothetical protein